MRHTQTQTHTHTHTHNTYTFPTTSQPRGAPRVRGAHFLEWKIAKFSRCGMMTYVHHHWLWRSKFLLVFFSLRLYSRCLSYPDITLTYIGGVHPFFALRPPHHHHSHCIYAIQMSGHTFGHMSAGASTVLLVHSHCAPPHHMVCTPPPRHLLRTRTCTVVLLAPAGLTPTPTVTCTVVLLAPAGLTPTPTVTCTVGLLAPAGLTPTPTVT